MPPAAAHPCLASLPWFGELAGTERTLIAGAGGGYDIFCVLLLYFSLRAQG